MRSRITKISALACAALVAAVAAQSSASKPSADPRSAITATLNKVKGMKLAAREKRLYQLARQEGTLEWYTSMSAPISEPVEKAFEAKYPGVEVNRFRASSETIFQRVVQEARAGTSGADVIETNGTEMLALQDERNVLIRYTTSPYRKGIPRFARFSHFTGDRIEHFIVAWNRNALGNDRPPRTWEELAEDKWRGRISMEPTDADWYYGLKQYLLKKKKWSRAKFDRVFRGMAQNSLIVRSHTTQANLLAAGQFAVCVSCHSHSIKDLIEKGAPLSFKPFVNPVMQRPQGVGIAQRLRHPAAALLFYDWLLTKNGGQRAMFQNHIDPARTDVGDQTFRGAKIAFVNVRAYRLKSKDIDAEYEALMRLGRRR